MADGYSRQLRAGAGGPDLPMVSPDAFGAGIGDAMIGLGRSIDTYQQTIRRRDQDAQLLDASRRVAELRISMAQSDQDDQAEAGPDGSGYGQARLDRYNQGVAAIAAGIRDPLAQKRFGLQAEQGRASLVEDSERWEAQARGRNVAANGKAIVDLQANALDSSSNPVLDVIGSGLEIDQARDAMAGLVGAAAANSWHREADAAIHARAAQRMITLDPEAGKALLLRGDFDQHLAGDQKPQLLRMADTEITRRANQARTSANLAKEQAREQADLVLKRVDAGIDVSDAELARAQSVMDMLNIPGKSFDLGRARIENGLNSETRSWMPQQYDAEIDRLRDLRSEGKASADDQIRLTQLEKIAPGRKADIERDPFRFMADNGHPAPTIDAGDAASLARRGQWVDATARSLGRPVPMLSDAEAAPLEAIATRGTPAQQAELALTILSAGRYAKPLADQVASKNEGFRAALGLAAFDNGGALVRMALDGPAALGAHKGILTPVKDDLGRTGPTHQAIFDAETAQAMALMPPQYVRDTLLNATNIYAATAARAGWTVFHPGQFQRSIRQAIGGRDIAGGWQGGLGSWRDQSLVLPRGMPQQDFDRRLSRASDAAWHAASATGPAWHGDRPLRADEMRALVPTMTRDGVYALRQGNTYVTDQRGRRYEFDVRKLP